MNYDSFTDIEFNPKKSLNCQAEAAAIFVGLSKSGLIDEVLKDKKIFSKIVYQGNFETTQSNSDMEDSQTELDFNVH